jgi:hypothetical protein
MRLGDVVVQQIEADMSNSNTDSTVNGLLIPLGRGNAYICNEVWSRRRGAVMIGGQWSCRCSALCPEDRIRISGKEQARLW